MIEREPKRQREPQPIARFNIYLDREDTELMQEELPAALANLWHNATPDMQSTKLTGISLLDTPSASASLDSTLGIDGLDANLALRWHRQGQDTRLHYQTGMGLWSNSAEVISQTDLTARLSDMLPSSPLQGYLDNAHMTDEDIYHLLRRSFEPIATTRHEIRSYQTRQIVHVDERQIMGTTIRLDISQSDAGLASLLEVTAPFETGMGVSDEKTYKQYRYISTKQGNQLEVAVSSNDARIRAMGVEGDSRSHPIGNLIDGLQTLQLDKILPRQP